MKITILLFALLITMSAQAQQQIDLTPTPVDLHLSKYEDEYKTGKAFMLAGAGIILGSAAMVMANDKNLAPGRAIAVIGGAFSIFGFASVVHSRKHEVRAWNAERTAIR